MGTKGRIARWFETLSAFQFIKEYWPGNKHGNTDGMSWRCPNPHECKCPFFKEGEILKCGPCSKCCQGAVTVDSSLIDSQGNLRSRQIQGQDAVAMHMARLVSKIGVNSYRQKAQRQSPQAPLPKVDTDQSMAEQGITGAIMGRNSP